MMHLEGPPRGGIDSMESPKAEFSETRIGPIADNIIELYGKLPTYEQRNGNIVKKVINWGKRIDPEMVEELEHFLENVLHSMDHKEDRQWFKRILTSGHVESVRLYNGLLELEEILIKEVEKQERKELKDQDNKDRSIRRMGNGRN